MRNTARGIIILLVAAVLIGLLATFTMEALRDVQWQGRQEQHYECPECPTVVPTERFDRGESNE